MSVTRHLLHHPHSDLSAPTSDLKHLEGGTWNRDISGIEGRG